MQKQRSVLLYRKRTRHKVDTMVKFKLQDTQIVELHTSTDFKV